jgi:hypothetical protein
MREFEIEKVTQILDGNSQIIKVKSVISRPELLMKLQLTLLFIVKSL